MTHPHAHILQAIIDGKTVQYSANGNHWADINLSKDAGLDLLHGIGNHFYFRIKPTTVTINGVELEDDRITEYGDLGQSYFVESMQKTLFFYEASFGCMPTDLALIQRGIAHRTREGAIAFCKARLGIKD